MTLRIAGTVLAAALAGASIELLPAAAVAQQVATAKPADPGQVVVNAAAPGGPLEGATPAGKLVLLFGEGQERLDQHNEALLDQASRLYREGRPIIMVVSGSTDSVGNPTQNLLLSQRRANAVARGLLARGIPAQRTQILAKGETNPAVDAPAGTEEAQNRRVEITWR